MRTTPPSLLSLAIDTAILHISTFSDLSFLPDHIIHDLFLRTLKAGKLTEKWRPIFSRFHLIIVKDPDLKEELRIPEGFNLDVYSKSHIDRVVGSSSSMVFTGYSCRYSAFLYHQGLLIDAVAQHLVNLATPATPFFFNTLYDPYREGADFVRGYPFSLRSGVACALSCGLWLNLADLDAPTQALKPEQRNSRYAMMPLSGINIAFDREAVGPALLPALKLAGEGNLRWETMEDIWSGMCVKVVCDHLGLGVKSGLPYVELEKEWEGVKLMEEIAPFFQLVRLPQTAATTEDCIIEMAETVKQQLGPSNPVFTRAAEAMVEWVKLWKAVGSGSSPL
ncbi:UDP-arabinopyranose mutase [Salix suchowensis]|nr:UDP-arabinopyranose mutase [Salix suchowensis]